MSIWNLSLGERSAEQIERLQREIEIASEASPFGWGHTIDFGPFTKEGLLKDSYLNILASMEARGWLPSSLEGMNVADIGCFTGGVAAILARRGASLVYAVDEIPQHLLQAEIVCNAFNLSSVKLIESSLYKLEASIPKRSLDLIILSGVLYHLSDMLVGLCIMRELLKPEGVLLMESSAIDDDTRSYADYGRFCGGAWWIPTSLCIADMSEAMGFTRPDIDFYVPYRCISRATPVKGELPYVRGLNYSFDRILDLQPRSLDPGILAPAHPYKLE